MKCSCVGCYLRYIYSALGGILSHSSESLLVRSTMGACGSRGTMTMARLYEWDEKDVLCESSGSAVFRGKTRASREYVAIKRIEKKGGINTISIWEDEVAMLRQCSHHPNIIELKHVFHTPESVFLVTEFAEGGELFQTLISVSVRLLVL